MFVRFRKYSEKRKTSRKERFVCLAIILAELLPLAALSATEREKPALSAFFRNNKTLPDKLRRLFSGQSVFNGGVLNVSKQPFIGAVEITRIKISVAFNNKLMGAVTAERALLCPFSEIHSYIIVKLSDADIVSSHKVLDIQIENAYQKVGILSVCHIKPALLLAFKRAQARNELQIMKTVIPEVFIYLFASFGAVTGQNGQYIELHLMLLQKLRCFENSEICAFSVGINTEAVALAVSVKTQSDKELILPEKDAPFFVEQRSVSLNGKENP